MYLRIIVVEPCALAWASSQQKSDLLYLQGYYPVPVSVYLTVGSGSMHALPGYCWAHAGSLCWSPALGTLALQCGT